MIATCCGCIVPKVRSLEDSIGSNIGACEVGQGEPDEGLPVMHMVPNATWWIAAWCSGHISIDICTPPTLIDGERSYTDLELDPLAFSDMYRRCNETNSTAAKSRAVDQHRCHSRNCDAGDRRRCESAEYAISVNLRNAQSTSMVRPVRNVQSTRIPMRSLQQRQL